MGPLTSLEREPNMKTRLLPVLLLTATFPFAALAQSSSGTGGSSSSDQGTTNSGGTGGTSSSSNDNGTTTNSGTTSPSGTGGTSSSSNNNDTSGSGSNTSTSAPGTGGTDASSSSGTSATGTSPSADGSGTGAKSTSGSAGTASAETSVMIPGAAAMTVADLRGKTVYGVDGSSLGQINEVLASADGTANAVVIGVAGKNVVVSLSSLQMAPSQATGATGADVSSNSAGVSSAQANTASPSDARIVLNMTREQLDQAPAYSGSMAP